MNENRRRFGQRIRSAREAAHSSRDAVAEKAKIGVNYLGQIERGEKWPTLEVIVSVANAIGVSPSMFLDLDPVETEPEALKVAISQLLQNRDSAQLQVVFRVVKALLVG
jgi:transcriptional regulator with XRE-family HTH domain